MKKYPEIRQRGFYSEILVNGADEALGILNDGPDVHSGLLQETVIETKIPPTAIFDIPDVNLHNMNVHGPTTETTTIKDFPIKSYDPKVQLMFYTPPGKCPRKVEIERRKRYYASLDIEKLLYDDYGIKTEFLMPKKFDQHRNGINDKGEWVPYLFLDTFDDDDFDCRTPNEWLEMGMDGNTRRPIPARAILPSRDDQHDTDIKDPTID